VSMASDLINSAPHDRPTTVALPLCPHLLENPVPSLPDTSPTLFTTPIQLSALFARPSFPRSIFISRPIIFPQNPINTP